MIGTDIDDTYIAAAVKAQVIHQDAIDEMQKDHQDCLHPASRNRKYPGTDECLKELGFDQCLCSTKSRSFRTAISRLSAIRTRKQQKHLRWD